MRKLLTRILFRNDIHKYNEWTLAGYHGYCKIMEVIDGDTVNIGIIKNMHRFIVKLRISGVDVPETRTKNSHEKQVGLFVKNEVSDHLLHKVVRVRIDKHDKYGRALGDIMMPNNQWLSQWLLCNKFACAYNGGKKKEFAADFYAHILSKI